MVRSLTTTYITIVRLVRYKITKKITIRDLKAPGQVAKPVSKPATKTSVVQNSKGQTVSVTNDVKTIKEHKEIQTVIQKIVTKRQIYSTYTTVTSKIVEYGKTAEHTIIKTNKNAPSVQITAIHNKETGNVEIIEEKTLSTTDSLVIDENIQKFTVPKKDVTEATIKHPEITDIRKKI